MRSILIILALILGIVFYRYGRSIYMPLVNTLKSKETTESIYHKIEHGVQKRLQADLSAAGWSAYPEKISILAFKEERELHIYGHDEQGTRHIKTYPFTGYSGTLGPKLTEGDKQIPEGIYKVEYLNPNSAFYLSIKVDYPNAYDKSKSKHPQVKHMGGDIFIHGKSATIGCIPVGDEAIEELFLLTYLAKNQEVKIVISPRDFRKNPDYPVLDGIDWEEELYSRIHKELMLFPISSS